MLSTTLGRYFAGRFVVAAIGVFIGLFLLLVLVDYIEMVRRTSDLKSVSSLMVLQTSLFRVPLLLERLMPFCILIGGMTCYLALSRSLELVIARAAGISAWEFISPALWMSLALGLLATIGYNPLSASLQERSKQLEAIMFNGGAAPGAFQDASGFWLNQSTSDGQAIINAVSSQRQGIVLGGVTIFRYEPNFQFKDRIEAREAHLLPGRWRLIGVKQYVLDLPPVALDTLDIPTNLTITQVRSSFSTPETVPFWQLPSFIRSSENSGLESSGYRLQYHKLIARPFLFAAMVLLASAVSLRFFRFGGVQKMVLGGVVAGFLIYVLSKVTEDLSKADLMHPIVAAWLPVLVGGLTGFLALLYQEDG